jgi:pyruvate ferredoxin oxidoreductase gamma subunit
MIEIRWHGRGGQGAFTAARLLGAAAVLDGQFALAFPSFGPERRGAPVLAFTRIDGRRIGDRSALTSCDCAIVLDETLVGADGVGGIREGGVLLVNAAGGGRGLAGGGRVIEVDATALAKEILGRPMVNVAMLGALVAARAPVSLDAVEKAVRTELRGPIGEKNALLLRRCHDLVKEQLGG